jgi:hypothetical protein
MVRDLPFRPVVTLHDLRFEVTNDEKATFHDFLPHHIYVVALGNPGDPARYRIDMQKTIAAMIDAGIPKDTAIENARYARKIVEQYEANAWHFKYIAMVMIATVQIEEGGEPIMQFLSTEGLAAVMLPIETDLREAFIMDAFTNQMAQAKRILMALHVPIKDFDLMAENALTEFNTIPYRN